MLVGKSSCLALLSAILVLLLGTASHAAPALAGARVSPSQLDKTAAPASIINQGWLELHSSKHRQDPYVLGTNLIAAPESSNLDPLTAADDPFTSLQAVFVKGFDGALWGRWQVTTREGWGNWISFGSPNGVGLKSIPKAITNVNSLVSVFAVANDDQVYHITQLKDSTFSNWTLVGSLLEGNDAAGTSYPTVVKAKNGRLFAYVTVNGYVHETHEDTAGSGKWTTWVTRVMGDSQIKGTVSVALNTFTGYLEAFAVLNDGCIYQAWQNDDESWRGWKALWECWSQPTRFSSNVAIHSMTGSAWNGDLEIFARGDDNKIWHTWQTTCVPHTNPWSRCTWGAYYSEANDCPAPNNGEMVDIEVGSNIHGGLEVFVTGTNGHLYHIWQLEMWGGWSSSWQDLSHPSRGLLSSQPRVVHDKSGWWMAYVRGHDGDLEIYVQKRTMKIVPRIVPYGTPIQISWEVPEDEACNDDWLAVYQPQANNDKYLDFVYVQGEPNPGKDPVRNGNLNFGLYLPKGWYEVRYNVNRQPKDVLRTLFKISSDSDLLPAEQIFNGLVVGLGERGWDFENCTNDLVATFKTFELAFLHFHNKEIYEGLQALGQGIMDFADSMKACSDIYLAEKIEKFARDLIACTTGFCARFIISLVADILVIYMNRIEIWRDIEAATNDFEIFAYENAGVKIGDFIQAVIR